MGTREQGSATTEAWATGWRCWGFLPARDRQLVLGKTQDRCSTECQTPFGTSPPSLFPVSHPSPACIHTVQPASAVGWVSEKAWMLPVWVSQTSGTWMLPDVFFWASFRRGLNWPDKERWEAGRGHNVRRAESSEEKHCLHSEIQPQTYTGSVYLSFQQMAYISICNCKIGAEAADSVWKVFAM